MKCCPKCSRLYDATDAGFCPIDGASLASTAEATPPEDPDDRAIGSLICADRYQIWRKVADGGMGRVYQALDRELERNVAVKKLHPEVSTDHVALERFKREYALSSELPHEHIVEVLDFQETEDESFALVMEYLEGEELREFLKREKVMPAARLVRILSQLALGLKEPHQMKLVHRDIKPDNVFLCHTEDGPVVKLLDFGSVRDNTEGAKKLTVIGTTIGSPYYMSPEQAEGRQELDHRADVWSLAAIAYECLTGTVPFGGSSGPQILLAILGEDAKPPSVAGAAHGVPPTVDDVFFDALAKKPEQRLGSVAEMADRFGQAYGLTGSHHDWAYLKEAEIEQRIQQCLPALMAARPVEPVAVAEIPAAAAATAAVEPAPANVFDDADFVMGVPQGPPTGIYIAIGVGLLLVLIVVVALVLQ